MPHLKLGARRVRFDFREIETWLHRECRNVRYGKWR
jgi:predicted DNA-binding transcriptional regulator AlpA